MRLITSTSTLYIHAHTHTHTHIYIYIYIHIHTWGIMGRWRDRQTDRKIEEDKKRKQFPRQLRLGLHHQSIVTHFLNLLIIFIQLDPPSSVSHGCKKSLKKKNSHISNHSIQFIFRLILAPDLQTCRGTPIPRNPRSVKRTTLSDISHKKEKL